MRACAGQHLRAEEPDIVCMRMYTFACIVDVWMHMHARAHTHTHTHQTGAGKTHTMLGGADEHRGIIPRSIEQILSTVAQGQSNG